MRRVPCEQTSRRRNEQTGERKCICRVSCLCNPPSALFFFLRCRLVLLEPQRKNGILFLRFNTIVLWPFDFFPLFVVFPCRYLFAQKEKRVSVMWLIWSSPDIVDPDAERVIPADIGPWGFEEVENALRNPSLASGPSFVAFFKKMNARWLERLANPLDGLGLHCCQEGQLDACSGGLSLTMQSLLLIHGSEPLVASCALRVLLSIAAGNTATERGCAVLGSEAVGASVAGGHVFSSKRLYTSQFAGLVDQVDEPQKPFYRSLTQEERQLHSMKLATTLTKSKAQDFVLLSCSYAVLATIGMLADKRNHKSAMLLPKSLDWRCEMLCSAACQNQLLVSTNLTAPGARASCIEHCSSEAVQLVCRCVASQIQQITKFLSLAAVEVLSQANSSQQHEHQTQLRLFSALQSAGWALIRFAGASIRAENLADVLAAVHATLMTSKTAATVSSDALLAQQQFLEDHVDTNLREHVYQVLGSISASACQEISVLAAAASTNAASPDGPRLQDPSRLPSLLSGVPVSITSLNPVWSCCAFLTSAFHERWVVCTSTTFAELIACIQMRVMHSTTPSIIGSSALLSIVMAMHVALVQRLRADDDVQRRINTVQQIFPLVELLIKANESDEAGEGNGISGSPSALHDSLRFSISMIEFVRMYAQICASVCLDTAVGVEKRREGLGEDIFATEQSLRWRGWLLLQRSIEQLEARIADADKAPTQQPKQILLQEASVAVARLAWAELARQQSLSWRRRELLRPFGPANQVFASLIQTAPNALPSMDEQCGSTTRLVLSSPHIGDTGVVLEIPERIWTAVIVPQWRDRNIRLLRTHTARISAGKSAQHFGDRVLGLSASPNAAQREKKVLSFFTDRAESTLRDLVQCCLRRASSSSSIEGSKEKLRSGREVGIMISSVLDAMNDVVSFIRSSNVSEDKACYAVMSDVVRIMCDAVVSATITSSPHVAVSLEDESVTTDVSRVLIVDHISTSHIRSIACAHRAGNGWFSSAAFTKSLEQMVCAVLAQSPRADVWRTWVRRTDVRLLTWFRPQERTAIMEVIRMLFCALRRRNGNQMRVSTATHSFQRVLWNIVDFVSWAESPPRMANSDSDSDRSPNAICEDGPRAWWTARHDQLAVLTTTDKKVDDASRDWLQRVSKNSK